MFVKLGKMLKSLIRMPFFVGNIEHNPGPERGSGSGSGPFDKTKYIDIVTFNCNGLGDRKKLKRVMDKASKVQTKVA